MKTDVDSRTIATLAFFKRAFGRSRRPFENVSQRSADALRGLSAAPESLGFKIALRHLRYDWDLLTEEATRDDTALQLQIRVLDLASELPEADRLLRSNLERTPLSRLFWAILAQGTQDSAQTIDFRFRATRDSGTSVVFRSERGETEAMTIPASLDEGIRGLLRFVETVGYARLHAYLHPHLTTGLPRQVEFQRSGPDRVVLSLSN